MENDLFSMLDVFPDLVQAITKLVKIPNEKIVLESINYLIICISYLYDRMGLKPYIIDDHKRDSILSSDNPKLRSIEEVKSEDSSPFIRAEKMLLNPGGYPEELSATINEFNFSPASSLEKCQTPMKLQAGAEVNTFELMVSKVMATPSSMGTKEYKRLLESF